MLALSDTYQKTQNQDVFLLKTDHELFANDHLSLRYNRQKFTGGNFENGNATSVLQHTGDSLVQTDTFSFSNSTIINNSLFNEVRGQYAKDSEPGKANSADPEAQINQDTLRVINIGRNTFSPRETTIKRHQIADTLTDVIGATPSRAASTSTRTRSSTTSRATSSAHTASPASPISRTANRPASCRRSLVRARPARSRIPT